MHQKHVGHFVHFGRGSLFACVVLLLSHEISFATSLQRNWALNISGKAIESQVLSLATHPVRTTAVKRVSRFLFQSMCDAVEKAFVVIRRPRSCCDPHPLHPERCQGTKVELHAIRIRRARSGSPFSFFALTRSHHLPLSSRRVLPVIR